MLLIPTSSGFIGQKFKKIRCFALASFSTFEDHYLGDQMFKFAQELWPLNRSLTGEGNRQTLKKIKSLVPELEVKSFSLEQRCSIGKSLKNGE